MKYIPLTDGSAAKVSDASEELLSPYRWSPHQSKPRWNTYASTTVWYLCPLLSIKRRRRLYMHRLVTDCPPGLVVDHWDHDTLNNQDWNLRVTTILMNNANIASHATSLIPFRGVSMCRGRFRARIQFEGDEKNLGHFSTAEDAARAYDTAALELYGAFAWQNFDTGREDAIEAARQLHEDIEAIPF